MNKKEKEHVNDCIENEGFDYCFVNYSSFTQIKDKKFHELREAYLKAYEDLEKYVADE
jgi:hypothetical protein